VGRVVDELEGEHAKERNRALGSTSHHRQVSAKRKPSQPSSPPEAPTEVACGIRKRLARLPVAAATTKTSMRCAQLVRRRTRSRCSAK
jgi:hypothetical protein